MDKKKPPDHRHRRHPLLIVAAMFTSFGRSLFSMRTEHIQLPEPGASSSQEGSSQSAELFRGWR